GASYCTAYQQRERRSRLGRSLRSRVDRHLCNPGRNNPRHCRAVKSKAVAAGEEVDRTDTNGQRRSVYLLPEGPTVPAPALQVLLPVATTEVCQSCRVGSALCARLRRTRRLRFLPVSPL